MPHFLTKNTLSILSVLLLAGCSSDEYLGPVPGSDGGHAIAFSGSTGKAARATGKAARATTGGEAAADILGRQFVVFGSKTTGAGTQTVFDYYNVFYTTASAGTTSTNSAGWDYLGFSPAAPSSLPEGTEQSIKYWDYSAERYDFMAFATGPVVNLVQPLVALDPEQPEEFTLDYTMTPAAGTVFVKPSAPSAPTSMSYTLVGATTDVTQCLISDLVTARHGATAQEGLLYPTGSAMTLRFHPFGTSVRIGLYETVPGFSVRDVRFYPDDDAPTPVAQPTLYAASAVIPAQMEATITFPQTSSPADADYNRYAVATAPRGTDTTPTLPLGTALAATAAKEVSETPDGVYLGRSAAEASMTQAVLCPAMDLGGLTLKADFTLVSVDYNETIEVTGVTAHIPAAYTDLKGGCAYTYLFKITDALTTPDGHRVLYPIQFDALEVNDYITEEEHESVVNP